MNLILSAISFFVFAFNVLASFKIYLIVKRKGVKMKTNDKAILLMLLSLVICYFFHTINYMIKTYGYLSMENYHMYVSSIKQFNYVFSGLAYLFFYISIIINLRNWIFFYIKIGSLAENPYAREDVDNCVNDKYFSQQKIDTT